MKSILSESTKTASYLLWENTKHNNALELWYCSENIAYFFEENGIISVPALKELVQKSKYDYGYIRFVREIAFLIFRSTGNMDSLFNWFVAEKLLKDTEWCSAIIKMAYLFRAMKEGQIELFIRSDWIRRNLENSRALKK